MAEQPLEQNDMISFGFNTAAVYDVDDKNAFIYVLRKEQIETIDLDDSDDEAPDTTTRIIDIAEKVIDIDSDSDSNYSGDECIQDLEEIKEEVDPSATDDDSMDPQDSYDDSDSIDSEHSDEFVVTKTILKCATPTETIDIDDEDDDAPQVVPEAKIDVEDKIDAEIEAGTVADTVAETEAPNEAESKTDQNGIAKPDKEAPKATPPSASNDDDNASLDAQANKENDASDKIAERTSATDKEKSQTKGRKEKTNDKTPTENDTAGPSKVQSEDERIQKIKRRLDIKKTRTVMAIKPLSIRKRRQTVTEEEYIEHKRSKREEKEQIKKMRKERLSAIAEREQAARETPTETHRTQFIPKVKNVSVSRGEQLCTDFLALDPSNT